MTSTTLGSTAQDDLWRARYSPPDLLRRTNLLLDELVDLRVEVQRLQPTAPDPDKAAAKKARALHAGATKSERLHAAMNAGVDSYRMTLAKWTGPGTATARACWLTKLIHPDAKMDKNGRPSGWRTVYEYLKTLQL